MDMTAVLGIDSAWTVNNSSGVALVESDGNRWRCRAVAPDYSSFYKIADGRSPDWTGKLRASAPNPSRLLKACAELLDGRKVDLVTIDMPVSKIPIYKRRPADDLISRAYGSRGCSTHSPIWGRPGLLSEKISNSFKWHGYPLATADTKPGTPGCLVEVFPHPALLTLLDENYRIPYKVLRTKTLWPDASLPERKILIRNSLDRILDALKSEIDGINLAIDPQIDSASFDALLPYEHALDALVCAWVGIRFLEGKATPYGDSYAAIWVPE